MNVDQKQQEYLKELERVINWNSVNMFARLDDGKKRGGKTFKISHASINGTAVQINLEEE